MKGTRAFVEALKHEGVKYVVGLMGDLETSLYPDYRDAHRSGSLNYVPVAHEQSGAIIADVIGRYTGNCAVAHSTVAPGACNMITGIANAFQDRSPVIAVSAQVAQRDFHPETHQYVDLQRLFDPVTKKSVVIERASDMFSVVGGLKFLAEQERQGPVHLTLPIDVLGEECSQFSSYGKNTSSPKRYDMTYVANLLNTATSPVVLVGNIRQDVSEELDGFLRSTGLPVLTTFHGKGMIPEDHPNYLGTISRHIPETRQVFRDADVVLCIGYDYIEGVKPSLWQNGDGKVVISLDTVPNSATNYYSANVEMSGDLKDMITTLSKQDLKHRETLGNYSKLKVRMPEYDREYPIRPEAVVDSLNRLLPRDSIVVSDVGWHKQYLGLYLNRYHPKSILFSNGLSQMGFSVPASIGAKLVNPNRQVVSVSGDRGFQMNVQELETARTLNLPITFLVFNDGGLGLVRSFQNYLDGDTFGTSYKNPNFVKLAEAYGLTGYRVESPDQLDDILQKALEGFSIVDIPVTYDQVKWGK